MSHQTGICASENLLKVFGKAKTGGKIRALKVSIENESLVPTGTAEVKKDWEKDYDKTIAPLLEESVPCYIFYRFDSKSSLGYEWLLISWVPDTATIRQKMVYASTKATLKTDFSSAYIKEELHATTLEETTLEGYYRNQKAFASPAPLTMREEEMRELQQTAATTSHVNVNTRQPTMHGVQIPLSESAIGTIRDFIRGSYNYVQFSIDLKDERILVAQAGILDVADLSKKVPDDHARYHLYLFKHTHDGNYYETQIFIYSMPGSAVSVKERMLYSSCKAPFEDRLKELGVDIVKKLEIDSGAEVTEACLLDELHPPQTLHRQAFAKPKGPPGRGARRLLPPQVQS